MASMGYNGWPYLVGSEPAAMLSSVAIWKTAMVLSPWLAVPLAAFVSRHSRAQTMRQVRQAQDQLRTWGA